MRNWLATCLARRRFLSVGRSGFHFIPVDAQWRRVPNAQPVRSFPRLQFAFALAMLFGVVFLSAGSQAQTFGQPNRAVQGKVFNSNGTPQQDAVVYLKNEKTLEIKTYITTADGSYRFGQIGSDANYQVWARYKGTKSKTRSISSFDSKKLFTFDFKLEP